LRGFDAKKRFGLSVLDYMVTCNHIHLLIKGHRPFGEDRYHATAIETDEHLHRCLVYIALNMVRAGVVDHPVTWEHSGYREIQQPPKRYAVIDLPGLVVLCGVSRLADFQQAHCQWIEAALHGDLAVRDARWSEAVAVGSLAFVEKIKGELGVKALHREVEQLRWKLCVARTR
jgi:putative transposase